MSVQQLSDSERLDLLERTHGYVAGSHNGAPAYRLFGSDRWRTSLREAIDHYARDRIGSMAIQSGD
jgi:hypothetical protein